MRQVALVAAVDADSTLWMVLLYPHILLNQPVYCKNFISLLIFFTLIEVETYIDILTA